MSLPGIGDTEWTPRPPMGSISDKGRCLENALWEQPKVYSVRVRSTAFQKRSDGAATLQWRMGCCESSIQSKMNMQHWTLMSRNPRRSRLASLRHQ